MSTQTALKQRHPKTSHDRDETDVHEHISEIQRTRILRATVAVMAEQGATSITVAHIVSRSGVSRRTFYEFFTDCEECYLAALDEAVAQAARRVRDAYDPRDRWRVRTRKSLLALLDLFEEEPARARLLLVESLAAGPRALRRRARTLAQIIDRIGEGATLQPSRLVAEGTVGAVLSILHARIVESEDDSIELLDLANPLMSMITLSYLGTTASRQELTRPLPKRHARAGARSDASDPWRELGMRLTYRTVRALHAVALSPGSSNRVIGESAGITDQGQISKLLRRLEGFGLVQTNGAGFERGEPNAWTLTTHGHTLLQTIS